MFIKKVAFRRSKISGSKVKSHNGWHFLGTRWTCITYICQKYANSPVIEESFLLRASAQGSIINKDQYSVICHNMEEMKNGNPLWKLFGDLWSLKFPAKHNFHLPLVLINHFLCCNWFELSSRILIWWSMIVQVNEVLRRAVWELALTDWLTDWVTDWLSDWLTESDDDFHPDQVVKMSVSVITKSSSQDYTHQNDHTYFTDLFFFCAFTKCFCGQKVF